MPSLYFLIRDEGKFVIVKIDGNLIEFSDYYARYSKSMKEKENNVLNQYEIEKTV